MVMGVPCQVGEDQLLRKELQAPSKELTVQLEIQHGSYKTIFEVVGFFCFFLISRLQLISQANCVFFVPPEKGDFPATQSPNQEGGNLKHFEGHMQEQLQRLQGSVLTLEEAC